MKEFLYLGIKPPCFLKDRVCHTPLIKPFPLSLEKRRFFFETEKFSKATHILFTSQVAVEFFFSCVQEKGLASFLQEKKFISVGPATQKKGEEQGVFSEIPKISSQEGLMDFFEEKKEKRSIFWPRSCLARKDLLLFFQKKGIFCFAPIFYFLQYQNFKKKIPWERIRGIIFTSPSTVEAFLRTKEKPPFFLPFFFQGESTKNRLLQKISCCPEIYSVDILRHLVLT